MPWDELQPREFAAFDRELDGISCQTMDDHEKRYEGCAKKANECRKMLNELDYGTCGRSATWCRLAIDVYEHACVRDFGATPDGRKQYVEAFSRNLNWHHVNHQLAQAEAAKQGADASGAQEPSTAGA